jgi:hypothetical protein
MDNSSLASGSVGAAIVVGIGIAYKVYTVVNHHRIKSNCMGKEFSASIDIDETTPQIKIKVPVDKGDGPPGSPHSQREQDKR